MRTGIYPPELRSVNLDFDVSTARACRPRPAPSSGTFGPLDRKLRSVALGAFAG